MRKSTFFITLGLWAILVTLGGLLSHGQGLAGLAAFPWAPLGQWLRSLSLSGGAGSALSLGLWLLTGLLPLAAAGILRRKGRRAAALPLALLCPVLLAGLYAAVNPGGLLAESPSLLGTVLWGCLLGCAVLGLVVALCSGEGQWRAAAATLWVLAALFLLEDWGLGLVSLRHDLAALPSAVGSETPVGGELFGAPAGSYSLSLNRLILLCHFVVHALPAILDVWIISELLELLEALKAGRYTQHALDRAEALAGRCRRDLMVILISQVAFALLQLLLAGQLLAMSVHVSVPLATVAFALTALVATRLLRQGKALQDDHDLFV